MRRQRKLQLSILLVISFILSSFPAAAQNNAVGTSDWSSVKSVAAGSKLAVKLRSGKTYQGTLNSVSDDGITMSIKGASQELKRADILTVHQMTSKSAAKAALIGTGVGAGTGAVIGVAGSGSDNSFDKLDHAVTAGLTVAGAAVGAITGYLVGKTGSKRVLIYKAP